MPRKAPYPQVTLPRLSIGPAQDLLEELQRAHVAVQASKRSETEKRTPQLESLIVRLDQGIRDFRAKVKKLDAAAAHA